MANLLNAKYFFGNKNLWSTLKIMRSCSLVAPPFLLPMICRVKFFVLCISPNFILHLSYFSSIEALYNALEGYSHELILIKMLWLDCMLLYSLKLCIYIAALCVHYCCNSAVKSLKNLKLKWLFNTYICQTCQ